MRSGVIVKQQRNYFWGRPSLAKTSFDFLFSGGALGCFFCCPAPATEFARLLCASTVPAVRVERESQCKGNLRLYILTVNLSLAGSRAEGVDCYLRPAGATVQRHAPWSFCSSAFCSAFLALLLSSGCSASCPCFALLQGDGGVATALRPPSSVPRRNLS